MNTGINQYLKELHIFIEYQAKKLKKLESTVGELQQEVASLKERPPVHVGRLEYKFDQLKVETLEGTLNIGLNPADLEGVSDFSVDNQNIQVPSSPKKLFKANMEIENELREFLETDLPGIYQSAQEKLNMNVDDSYYDFIKEDILKQLPNRIQSHLHQLDTEDRENKEMAQQKIAQKLKDEVHQGVYLFLEQIQKQTKGEEK